MRKAQSYFISLLIIFIIGCKQDIPVSAPCEEAELELEENEVRALSCLQTSVPLEILCANTDPGRWEQFFAERGAAYAWKLLQQTTHTFQLEFENLIPASIAIPNRTNEVTAGIIQYLAIYQRQIPIKHINLLGDEQEEDEESKLTYLPPAIGRLTNLETLNLFNNKLTALPNEIAKLTNLRTLDLSYNELLSITPEISKLTRLEALDLSFNHLTKITPAINTLTNLVMLDLSFNQIKKLPSSLLPKLGRLEANTLVLPGNPWLDVRRVVLIHKAILTNYACQELPHNLSVLCMKHIEDYISLHPKQQKAIDNKLPLELCQAARNRELKQKCTFKPGKNIVLFKNLNGMNIPFLSRLCPIYLSRCKGYTHGFKM